MINIKDIVPEETLSFIAEADHTAMVGTTCIRASKGNENKIFSFSSEEIVALVIEEVRKRNKKEGDI